MINKFNGLCDWVRDVRCRNRQGLKNRAASVVPSEAQQSKLCRIVHPLYRCCGNLRWL